MTFTTFQILLFFLLKKYVLQGDNSLKLCFLSSENIK